MRSLRRGDDGGRRGGFALALAAILLAFLAALAFGFAGAVRSEVRISDHHGIGAQAFWTAGSGLERGWYRLYVFRPAVNSWTESRTWSSAAGAFSGGRYVCAISAAEDLTAASPTFGDVRLRAAATIAGYAEVRGARTLLAALPNLANDDDGRPATAPTMAASSDDGSHPAAMGNDGNLATAWTAAAAATAGAPQWLAATFSRPEKLRKVQAVCPDARIAAYEIEVDAGGWTAVSGAAKSTASGGGLRTLAVVFDEVAAAAVRIRITRSTGAPRIAELKAYPPARGARLSEPGS
jgi:hypothetical protein